MIRVEIGYAKHRDKYRVFLLAVAPTGHILGRRMLGASMSPQEMAERVRDYTMYWAGKPYRSLVMRESIADFLL